jgi:hypothetical protein
MPHCWSGLPDIERGLSTQPLYFRLRQVPRPVEGPAGVAGALPVHLGRGWCASQPTGAYAVREDINDRRFGGSVVNSPSPIVRPLTLHHQFTLTHCKAPGTVRGGICSSTGRGRDLTASIARWGE